MREKFKEHYGIVLLIIVFIVFATLFNVINPIHESPDEIRHYRYIRYLADFHQLPIQSGEAGNAQAHHPPLYYLTAAAATFWVHPDDPLGEPEANPFWGYQQWEVGTDNKNLYLHPASENYPYKDEALAAHLARFITTLWGAAAVVVTYFLALEILPNKKKIALLASMLVGFNPQFLYLSGSIINDVPAGFMGGLLTLQSIRLLREGLSSRRLLWIAITYGFAVLVKINLVAMLGVVGLAIIIAIKNDKKITGKDATNTFLKSFGIVFGGGLIIAGWFFIRNTVLYGEPSGMATLASIWGGHSPLDYLSSIGQELIYAWTSLWGRFGYGQIVMPRSYYWLTFIICFSGSGLFILSLKGNSPFSRYQKQAFIILGVTIVGNFLILFAYLLLIFAGAMGRFFFPALPAFSVLIALGYLGKAGEKASNVMVSLFAVILTILTFTALFGFIQPAYAVPADDPRESLGESIAVFADNIELVDYALSSQTAAPGEEISLTATWLVLNPTSLRYVFYIHLVNEKGEIVSQRDTYSGLGNYPSDFWHTGHVFTETYHLIIPEGVDCPAGCDFRIGFFNETVGTLLLADGAPELSLGRFQIGD